MKSNKLTSTTCNADELKKEQKILEKVFAAANGKATRYVYSVSDIRRIVEDIEADLLSRGVTQGGLCGTMVLLESGGDYVGRGRAYKIPTTKVVAKRVRDGWRILSVERSVGWTTKKPSRRVTISQKAADDIQRKMYGGLQIARAA